MIPGWQVVLLILFLFGLVVFIRPGMQAIRQVFQRPSLVQCTLLVFLCSLYVVCSQHFAVMTTIAVALLIVAIGLEWKMRERTSAEYSTPRV